MLYLYVDLHQDWFDAKKLDKKKREGATDIVHQEQKNSILSQIHHIIGPFILRRKKADVDTNILPKKEVLVYCPFTIIQRCQYQLFVNKLKRDKKWASQNECLGGALGLGWGMQYMMVKIIFFMVSFQPSSHFKLPLLF